jgi:hypothetical protein
MARGILFSAALLLGTQVLAAQQSAAPDQTGQGWPQSPAPTGQVTSPASVLGQRLIRFSGRAMDAAGRPVAGIAGVTFAIYEEQNGGAPLWQETQNLVTGADGHFSALLGATTATGIPPELFAGADSRWLGVLTAAPGASEQPRVLLVSVPYALRSADSEMLGGKPASSYLTVSAPDTTPGGCPGSGTAAPATPANKMAPALTASSAKGGYLPVFTDASGDLQNSALVQLNVGTPTAPVWNLGFGTSAPAFNLNFVSRVDPAAIAIDGYGAVGINFIGRRAEGTLAAPSAILSGDNIMAMQGRGYGATKFSTSSRAYMKFFAAENWTDAAQGTYISLATTPTGTAAAAERLRITAAGNVGIGTTTPTHTLSLGGAQAATVGVEANPTAGSAGNNLTISAGAAAPGSTNKAGGDLVLAAGNGTGTGAGGNVRFQAAGNGASGDSPGTVSDRLLIAGKPKTMLATGTNLFSVHIATGEAAGGRVQFTIVASDGTNYAAETGELIYLATPKQAKCAVVQSEISQTPPTYTWDALGFPAAGQPGFLNAQCNPHYFGSDPGVQIFDTAPTSFTPTTHKVYYTIENQSQAVITLQP